MGAQLINKSTFLFSTILSIAVIWLPHDCIDLNKASLKATRMNLLLSSYLWNVFWDSESWGDHAMMPAVGKKRELLLSLLMSENRKGRWLVTGLTSWVKWGHIKLWNCCLPKCQSGLACKVLKNELHLVLEETQDTQFGVGEGKPYFA